jgi:hypothetical protein
MDAMVNAHRQGASNIIDQTSAAGLTAEIIITDILGPALLHIGQLEPGQ